MGCRLHQAIWNLLRRLSDTGPHFETKRVLVQKFGRRVQSHARGRQGERRLSGMNSHASAVGLAISLIACGAGIAQDAAQPLRPWMNAALSPDARADMVIEQLTFEEKIQLVH